MKRDAEQSNDNVPRGTRALRARLTARRVVSLLTNRLERKLARKKLRSYPPVVDVVLTKACNLACTFCRDYEHPGAKRVSVENLERVAAQLFPTASWVNVCSGGEPYLHDGLEALLRLARGHGAKTWVLSNGMLLDEARMRAILEQDLITLHGFSIDGMRAETVESIRLGADLARVLANVDMVLRLRRELGRRDPGIVIRYAIMRRNIEELPAAVRYWGERGVQRIDASYLALANEMDEQESLFHHQELMVEVFGRARDEAADFPAMQLALPNTVADEAEKLASPSACRAPWEFVMIDSTGRVLPCYRAFEAIHMGALHGPDAQPFDQIWNSADYQALRGTVNDDSAKKHFSYCSVCEYRYGWGRSEPHLGDGTWMRAALGADGEPLHVDHSRAGLARLRDRATKRDAQ